jgi:cbb3-type cytochrome oxidase maturation protein
MSALYIVFPLALLIAAGAVVLFVWAVRSGQFDDTETPGMRILHDDEPVEKGSEAAGPEEGKTAAREPRPTDLSE